MATIAVEEQRQGASLRLRFTLAIFAGSFLLFLVQPMLARMALPRLGGAPAVWNSAMLVYQGLLLAGYAYAHAIGRLPGRAQAGIHLVLLALAALTLPLGLNTAVPDAGDNSFLWVPLLLLLSVGPLFLVISAQAPLLQRWFAISGGGDPYPLYAASNLGSLLGLLTYPLLLEPMIGVSGQSWWWSLGYAVMALLVAWCMLALHGWEATAAAPGREATAAPLSKKRIGRWIVLAAVPSGLMLSTTLHLTTDIAAMPLLWVVPLALYLLSFTVAFSTRRVLARLCALVAPFTLLLVCVGLFRAQGALLLPVMLVSLLNLFLVAVALHAKLFDDRPDPAQLTAFYLAMSIGGALGGLFCALLAPLIFDWTYEHPILLLAAGALVAGKHPFRRLEQLWRVPGLERRMLLLLVLLTLLSLLARPLVGEQPGWLRYAGLGLLMAFAAVSIGRPLLFTASLAALLLAMGGIDKLSLTAEAGKMTRSYFGVYSIQETEDLRYLLHGTTMHGLQLRGSPARERHPTSYYAPGSAVGRVLAAAPHLYGPAARIGAVGLGTGTLACYARPGERWTFYEIDPVMVEIARDPTRFTFLPRCQPNPAIVLGDARLSLARQQAGTLDVLVIDAFSSDAVPMHLLTREAFNLYRRVLQPDGVLLVHISNRHLDLQPVVAAAARGRFHALLGLYDPLPRETLMGATPSRWITLSPSAAKLRQLRGATEPDLWKPLPSYRDFHGWTDDHGSILPIIKR